VTTRLFYRSVVALHRERHRTLRLRRGDPDVRYAADTHYVPMAGTEFHQAARDYPLLFTGDEEPAPIALLGLRAGENLMVMPDGTWMPGTYVPAFVRRYPFILGRDGAADRVSVCIDEDHPGLSRDAGERLFDDSGGEMPWLAGLRDFLLRYDRDLERTRAFASRLTELGLLIRRDLRISDSAGGHYRLDDCRIVDEARLGELGADVVEELHRAGWLGWIHAHLVSLGNVDRLAHIIAGRGGPARANVSA
jgi:hypothetical protein